MTMHASPLSVPTLQTPHHGTPHPHRRLIAVAIAALGLLALSAAALPSTAASAPAVAVAEPVAVSLSLPAEQKAVGLGCWVTGDMVWSPEETSIGDPAEIARAACGGR
jgi:hypothetical protein